MQNVTIRPADKHDIPEMARLWHEKMVLHQQFDRRFTLLPDGQVRWTAEASNWLVDARYAAFVAGLDDRLIGYIIGCVQPGPVGMSPEKIGMIHELTIDSHSYQGGVGRMLLQPLRDWFAAQDISHVFAVVSQRQAVEQAFWRALGAVEWMNVMWIKS